MKMLKEFCNFRHLLLAGAAAGVMLPMASCSSDLVPEPPSDADGQLAPDEIEFLFKLPAGSGVSYTRATIQNAAETNIAALHILPFKGTYTEADGWTVTEVKDWITATPSADKQPGASGEYRFKYTDFATGTLEDGEIHFLCIANEDQPETAVAANQKINELTFKKNVSTGATGDAIKEENTTLTAKYVNDLLSQYGTGDAKTNGIAMIAMGKVCNATGYVDQNKSKEAQETFTVGTDRYCSFNLVRNVARFDINNYSSQIITETTLCGVSMTASYGLEPQDCPTSGYSNIFTEGSVSSKDNGTTVDNKYLYPKGLSVSENDKYGAVGRLCSGVYPHVFYCYPTKVTASADGSSLAHTSSFIQLKSIKNDLIKANIESGKSSQSSSEIKTQVSDLLAETAAGREETTTIVDFIRNENGTSEVINIEANHLYTINVYDTDVDNVLRVEFVDQDWNDVNVSGSVDWMQHQANLKLPAAQFLSYDPELTEAPRGYRLPTVDELKELLCATEELLNDQSGTPSFIINADKPGACIHTLLIDRLTGITKNHYKAVPNMSKDEAKKMIANDSKYPLNGAIELSFPYPTDNIFKVSSNGSEKIVIIDSSQLKDYDNSSDDRTPVCLYHKETTQP